MRFIYIYIYNQYLNRESCVCIGVIQNHIFLYSTILSKLMISDTDICTLKIYKHSRNKYFLFCSFNIIRQHRGVFVVVIFNIWAQAPKFCCAAMHLLKKHNQRCNTNIMKLQQQKIN